MSLLVKRALDWAVYWHRSQTRKYPNVAIPYASHVAGVAAILSRHGFAEDVVAAGALHDTLEDCGVTFEELASRFGERVAALVRDVSEADKSQPWEVRKAQYLEHFPRKPWEAQAVSIADKIDNFESIAVCAKEYGDPWSMFKRGKDAQIERFTALLEMARKLPAHPIIDEYERAFEMVRAI